MFKDMNYILQQNSSKCLHIGVESTHMYCLKRSTVL